MAGMALLKPDVAWRGSILHAALTVKYHQLADAPTAVRLLREALLDARS